MSLGSDWAWFVRLAIVVCVCSGGWGCNRVEPARAETAAHWSKVQTDHFRVFTNTDERSAREVASQLEADLDALSQAAFMRTRLPSKPTDVVLFAQEEQFYEFEEESRDAVFYSALPLDPEAAPTVITFGSLNESARLRLLHELTHDLFARNFGAAPAWLNEGWAQYFSTIRVVDGQIVIGTALPNLTFTTEPAPFVGRYAGKDVVAVPVNSVVPPSRLLRMSSSEFYRMPTRSELSFEQEVLQHGRYLGAWAFVHWLLDAQSQYGQRFGRFLSRVRQTSVEQAWAVEFAGIDEAQLDRDFRAHIARGELAVFTLPYEPSAVRKQPVASNMSDAELHTLFARLYSGRLSDAGHALSNVKREIEAALVAAPTSGEAHFYRAQVAEFEQDQHTATNELLLAMQLAPQEPRYLHAHLMLEFRKNGGVLDAQELSRLEPHFQRLTETARGAMQLLTAATYLLAVGQADRALEFGRRAVALEAFDPLVLDTFASLLEQLGKLQEALEVERRAVAFLTDDQSLGPALRAHLAHLEKAVH